MNQKPAKPLTALQQSFLLINKLEAKISALENQQHQAIAIIGMGCRFPGGADNPESFWKLLQQQRSCTTLIPSSRWNSAQYYHPDPDQAGKMYVRHGSFLTDVETFDAHFFGISPREAASLDPQQRLLLEVTWESLEHAGLVATHLKGTRTGTFIGIGQHDYLQLQLNTHQNEGIDAYFGTGGGSCFAAGRLSYYLGLNGPSLSIDTACSSSLVAIHQACQSLRCGESDLALAGGVQLILSPEITLFLSRNKALAPDGRCKTFDASADGFGRGEGCGMVVLKRLSDAEHDGDTVLAVIPGSAINHDGASSGLTVPSGLAQQALIRDAIQQAGITTEQVDYIEAHGTGTELGDPLEVEALAEVFKQRNRNNPLLIGSVKTNIGHLEAAAGVAGLIKTVLALQHGEIPAHLNFKQPNPHIDWAQIPVKVSEQQQAWPVTAKKPRIAGVSAFGLSGANAHVLVAEAPLKSVNPVQTAVERPLHLLTLSAKSPEALQSLMLSYQNHMANCPSLNWADFCYSVNTGRCHFKYRQTVISASVDEFRQQAMADLSKSKIADSSAVCKIAFLFTGQGSHSLNMASELYQNQPLIRTLLRKCNDLLQPYLNVSLLDILYGEHSDKLQKTQYAQPVLFSLEYALAKLWLSWGIKPSVLVGHSLGEYVAACVAGVFSLEDGLKLVSERGRLMQMQAANGKMLAVQADRLQVNAAIMSYQGEVVIAAYNAPQAMVVSGVGTAIDALQTSFQQQGIATQLLSVSHAFHSPLMATMVDEFKYIAETISYHSPKIQLLSNLDGQSVNSEIATSDYWLRHTLAPVNFNESVKTLCLQGVNTFIEIGAKPVLSGLLALAWPDNNTQYHVLPSLRPDQSNWATLLQAVAQLYKQGVNIDWNMFDKYYQRSRIPVPTYPFQRKRHWVESVDKQSTEEAQQDALINYIEQSDVNGLRDALLKQQNCFTDEQQALLPEVLKQLLKLHQPILSDLYYQPSWRTQPLSQNMTTLSQDCWLIFADTGGLAVILANGLISQNQQVTLVYAGEQLKYWPSDNRWTINPERSTDFDALLTGLSKPVSRVVYLWAAEDLSFQTLDIEILNKQQRLGCQAALLLLQALHKHLPETQVCLVTYHAIAVSVDEDLSGLAQAPLWGFAKSWALEHPELWDAIVDMPLTESVEYKAQVLLNELLHRDNEDFIAYRNNQRYGLRLLRYQPEANSTVEIKDDASYLITGGLGALGLNLALWLVEQGATHIILTARNKASDRANSIIALMQQNNIRVTVVNVDVADDTGMSALFTTMSELNEPLRGIFHVAGIVNYDEIEGLAIDQLQAIMRPKVQGAWLLHQLSLDKPLDFFISFSSIAALWGVKGQAHYAAANQFLDALAHYRHHLGLPGLSINWGPWSEGGMATAQAQHFLQQQGIQSLVPKTQLSALSQLMSSSTVQAAVAKIDWSVLGELFQLKRPRPLLSEIYCEWGQKEKDVLLGKPVTDHWQNLTKEERKSVLLHYLQVQVTGILKIDVNDWPDLEQGFFSMGMDSLMAIELKNLLAAEFNAELPATLIFDFPTLSKLASFLMNDVLQWSQQQTVEDLATGEGIEDVETVEEIDKDIAERLKKLGNLLDNV